MQTDANGLPKMQSPKNNRRKLDGLILIKSCFGKAEFKAEGAVGGCPCFTIVPGLLYCIWKNGKLGISQGPGGRKDPQKGTS